MKKILLAVSVLVVALFGVLMVNGNPNEYEVTGEVREFIICQNDDNEGFFLEKTEATNHLKKGDIVEITTDENNKIVDVVKK